MTTTIKTPTTSIVLLLLKFHCNGSHALVPLGAMI